MSAMECMSLCGHQGHLYTTGCLARRELCVKPAPPSPRPQSGPAGEKPEMFVREAWRHPLPRTQSARGLRPLQEDAAFPFAPLLPWYLSRYLYPRLLAARLDRRRLPALGRESGKQEAPRAAGQAGPGPCQSVPLPPESPLQFPAPPRSGRTCMLHPVPSSPRPITVPAPASPAGGDSGRRGPRPTGFQLKWC